MRTTVPSLSQQIRSLAASILWSWVTQITVTLRSVFSSLSRAMIDDRFAGHRVEVAGRFIGQNHIRRVDQGAGHGHALLLAAGQFEWLVVQAVLQADALEHRHRHLLGGRLVEAGEHRRQGNEQ